MPTMKVDFKREFKELYAAPREPVLIDVPDLSFLMIDGRGDPSTAPEYTQAIEALYSVAYTLKFTLKRAAEPFDYAVMPLEGLWWAPDMSSFASGDRASWEWTAMIMQPDLVTGELVERALAEATAKKALPAAARLRLERFEEGPSAQVMHLGPYSAEGPTIARLHAFIAEQGLALRGKHHEVYLGDPRRTAPERLRTIVRQPVRDAS